MKLTSFIYDNHTSGVKAQFEKASYFFILYHRPYEDNSSLIMPFARMFVDTDGVLKEFVYPTDTIEPKNARLIFNTMNVNIKKRDGKLYAQGTLSNNFKDWIEVTIDRNIDIL